MSAEFERIQITEEGVWAIIADLFKLGWIDSEFLERATTLKQRGATWADDDFKDLFQESQSAIRKLMVARGDGRSNNEPPHGPHYRANARWMKLQIQ
jgi:hypothetical protein